MFYCVHNTHRKKEKVGQANLGKCVNGLLSCVKVRHTSSDTRKSELRLFSTANNIHVLMHPAKRQT